MRDKIEAIYENGHLRLLSPVELAEGQRVQVAIEPIVLQVSLRSALGDLLVHWPNTDDDHDAELEALAAEVHQAFQGQKPLSEIIIEDRGGA